MGELVRAKHPVAGKRFAAGVALEGPHPTVFFLVSLNTITICGNNNILFLMADGNNISMYILKFSEIKRPLVNQLARF